MNWKMFLIVFSLARATDNKEPPETAEALPSKNLEDKKKTCTNSKTPGKAYRNFINARNSFYGSIRKLYFAKIIARYYMLWCDNSIGDHYDDIPLKYLGIDLKKQMAFLKDAYKANRIIQTDPQYADVALECDWTFAKMEIHYMTGRFFEAMEAGSIQKMKMVAEEFKSLADRWMDVMEAYDKPRRPEGERFYPSKGVPYWGICESLESGFNWVAANVWYQGALIRRAEFNLALSKGHLERARRVFSNYIGVLERFKSNVERPSYGMREDLKQKKRPGGVLMDLGEYMVQIGVQMQCNLFKARFMSGDEDKFEIWKECKEFWGPMVERHTAYETGSNDARSCYWHDTQIGVHSGEMLKELEKKYKTWSIGVEGAEDLLREMKDTRKNGPFYYSAFNGYAYGDSWWCYDPSDYHPSAKIPLWDWPQSLQERIFAPFNEFQRFCRSLEVKIHGKSKSAKRSNS